MDLCSASSQQQLQQLRNNNNNSSITKEQQDEEEQQHSNQNHLRQHPRLLKQQVVQRIPLDLSIKRSSKIKRSVKRATPEAVTKLFIDKNEQQQVAKQLKLLISSSTLSPNQSDSVSSSVNCIIAQQPHVAAPLANQTPELISSSADDNSCATEVAVIRRHQQRRAGEVAAEKTVALAAATGRRLRHKSLKSHLCEQCGRTFARSDMLTRHSRLHSGVKPYQCSKCKQVFSRSDHLSTHERTHTGEKPYQCQFCSYSACRRDMITRHMRTHNTQQQQVVGVKRKKGTGKQVRIAQQEVLLKAQLNEHPSPVSSSVQVDNNEDEDDDEEDLLINDNNNNNKHF